jgi:alkylated DNA repair dioxygenase AlkB
VCLQVVLQVKAAIEQLQPGTSYNSCLLNLYRDGSHHVSWHSDNEKL